MKLEVMLGLVGALSFVAGWFFGEAVRLAWAATSDASRRSRKGAGRKRSE